MTDAATQSSSRTHRPAGSLAAPKVEQRHLLTDDHMITFIIQGYILITPDFRSGLNDEVCKQFDTNGLVNVDLDTDPYGKKIFEKAPGLTEVFDHPQVEGAFRSLLGENRFDFGWYCHATRPGAGGVGWHQDDVNIRHHQVRRLTVMYYPQDVTPDMGPTYVVPSTHFWNTPTDRMANLGNVRSQVALTVKAGTLAITHYDLWHTASLNSSSKTRYMVKLYTDRTQEPVRGKPTWNHDPIEGSARARQRFHHENASISSGTEFYKERHARWICWQHLLGEVPGNPLGGDLTRIPGNDATIDWRRLQGYIGDPRV